MLPAPDLECHCPERNNFLWEHEQDGKGHMREGLARGGLQEGICNTVDYWTLKQRGFVLKKAGPRAGQASRVEKRER